MVLQDVDEARQLTKLSRVLPFPTGASARDALGGHHGVVWLATETRILLSGPGDLWRCLPAKLVPGWHFSNGKTLCMPVSSSVFLPPLFLALSDCFLTFVSISTFPSLNMSEKCIFTRC